MMCFDIPLWLLELQAEEIACMFDNNPLFWHYFINVVYPRDLKWGEQGELIE